MAAVESKPVNAPMKKTKDSITEVRVLSLSKVDFLTKRINNASIQEFMEPLVMQTKLMNTGHSMKTVKWSMILHAYALMSIKRRALVKFGHILARTCLTRCGNHTVKVITAITSTSKTRTTVLMQEMYQSKLTLKLAHSLPLRNSSGLTTTGSQPKPTGSKDLATLVAV